MDFHFLYAFIGFGAMFAGKVGGPRSRERRAAENGAAKAAENGAAKAAAGGDISTEEPKSGRSESHSHAGYGGRSQSHAGDPNGSAAARAAENGAAKAAAGGDISTMEEPNAGRSENHAGGRSNGGRSNVGPDFDGDDKVKGSCVPRGNDCSVQISVVV